MSNILFSKIKKCELCKKNLPLSPRPVLQFSAKSKLIIVGQAPGIRAHDTNKPWNDPSGERLRMWLNIDSEEFYDSDKVALVPMAFCYPGTGKSGDLPPSKLCAPTWHHEIFKQLTGPSLILLIGKYAQDYYLDDRLSLTQRCKQWQQYLPEYFVLPHPSPRNNIWLKKNPWFEEKVLADLKERVNTLYR